MTKKKWCPYMKCVIESCSSLQLRKSEGDDCKACYHEGEHPAYRACDCICLKRSSAKGYVRNSAVKKYLRQFLDSEDNNRRINVTQMTPCYT